MTIRDDLYNFSESSGGKNKKKFGRFKRQNNTKKAPTTLALTIAQQWTLVRRSQENAGFYGRFLQKKAK